MIRVSLVRNVFEPARGRVEFLEPWRQGITARDLLPRDWLPEGTTAFDGPVKIGLDTPLTQESRLALVQRPGGLDPATAIIYATVLLFSSLVLRSMLPRPPRPRGDDSSAANGFSGIQSNRTEGEPIPHYYGKRPVGGQIVAEFIENKGALGSFYNALLSLGEGPVNRLMNRTTDTPVDAPLRTGDPSNPIPPGWLWVNDADASDLEDVEVHVRLGSLEQEAVPGFAFTTQTVTVDADIEGPAANYGNFSQRTYGEPIFADDNRDPTLASDGVTSSNGLWDEYGTAFSMTGEADEFSVTVDFPEGVGKTASDGYGLPWYWSLAARYIELDGSGTPIASGGSEGDGYVRLPAVPKFLSQFAPGQRVDLRFPFYDPQTYVRPAYSRVLKLNAAGSAVDAYLNAPIFRPVLIPDTTTTIDEFTLEAWTCLRPTDPTQPTDDNDIIDPSDLPSPGTIFSWFTTTGPQKGGFELVLQTVTVTIAPGQTRQRIVPLVYAKDTSGNTTSHYEKKGELGDVTFQIQLQRQTTPASDWHHIVFSYKSNVDGSLDRIRIYADGEKVYEALGAWNIGYPLVSTGPNVAAGARVGRSLLNINPFKGWIDNLVLWGGEMTADDVRLAYNGGLGRTLAGFTAYPGTGFTTRLFTSLMFTFDAVGDGDGRGNGESVPDTSGYNHVFTTVAPSPTSEQLTFGPTYGDRGFISVPSTTNTRKRGRYRVEVMRGIKDVGVPVQDEMRWSALQLHVDQLYTYPSSPLLGVRVRADGEINGQAPNLRALGEWRLVPVWDGASVSNPTFNREWSRNPAWICLDAALDPVSGMGSVFQPQDIVVQDWQDFADFCDEPVYDQRGQRQDYGDWTDMLYSSVLIGGTSPGIQIRLPAGNTPAHWIAGAYVGWYGLPAITAGGGPYEDTNVDPYGGGGYEIASVSPNVGGAGVDYVYVHWRGSSPPWTNGALLSTQISASMSGTIEGREPRFQCDAAVDEAGGGWDFIVQTCAAARAVPIRDGRKLRVRVEKPRPVRDLIGQGQVVPGTFEYEALSPKTRTNAVEISFQDADLAFDRSTALDEHPSIRGTSDLSQIRRKSYSLDGVTRRSQVLRHARYLLNRENLIRRKGRFRASLDLLGYEPGDVLQVAHDVADRGSGGRIISQPTSTTLYLDRAVTLESGKSYSILIRYQSAPEGELPEVLSVDETATGLGEKKGWEGEAITLTAAPSREVQKGDAFIWYELGRELFVSIDSISLTPDLQREVSWTEYVEEVYDVEGRDDLADIESESYLTTAPGRGTRSVPVVPEGVRVVERLTRSASGTAEHAVEVAWERPTQAVGIAGYDIFTGGRGAWRLAGSAGAGDSRAVVRVPGARHGDVVRVSVCPRSAGGLALAPDRGGRGSVKMLARELAPEAPSDLAASLAADAAAYSWTSGDTTETVAHELRRGGWILGQTVFAAQPGLTSVGASGSWVTPAPLADGSLPGVPLLLRARTRSNSYSAAARLDWALEPIDYARISDRGTSIWSQSWEQYGDGFVWDAPTIPNASLSGLERLADGSLGFSGSSLSGTYTTTPGDLLVGGKAEHVHLSAHAEAEQVHPLTWDEMPFAWEDPTSCWTWEGPLDVVRDGEDAGACTLTIEVRLLDEEGVYNEWQEYRPGRARCLAAQFRVTVTRPSTDFDVRIRRFSTDLLRIPRARWERSPLQALSHRKVLNRG